MKRYVLVKTTKDLTVGHLYEHIFLTELSNLLRNDGWLSFLDYDISGETLQAGIIILRLDIYNENLEKKFKKIVDNIKIHFSRTIITDAISQISAEKQMSFNYQPNKIMSYLQQLHSQDWLDLCNVKIRDRLKENTNSQVITVQEKQFIIKQLQIQLLFPIQNSKAELLAPLFLFVGRLLADNICELGENKFKCFNSCTWSDFTEQTMVSVVEFRQLGPDDRSDNFLQHIERLLKEVQHPKNISKMINFFHNTNWGHAQEWFISPFESIQECGELLGGQDWQELITKQNSLAVIQHIKTYCFYDEK